MSDDVALFIDFENLRYAMLNKHEEEPDLPSLLTKARKYGRPSVLRAYADFSEHPPDTTRKLQVVGVLAIDTPVKRHHHGREERITNAADMALALDALMEAVDAEHNQKLKTFLLVVGDRDYIKLVNLLRNRFGQRVVIVGVPKAISHELVAAAGEEDPIDVHDRSANMLLVKKAIVEMVEKGPSPLAYWSARLIDQWSQDNRNSVPGTVKQKRDAIAELLGEGVFVKRVLVDQQQRSVQEVILDDVQARERGYLGADS